jgi:hypothetical protein
MSAYQVTSPEGYYNTGCHDAELTQIVAYTPSFQDSCHIFPKFFHYELTVIKKAQTS